MNGILPLWKPKGMTSHDCVARVRRLFQLKKVGHTGTLDPEAEGVLPICIGHATKMTPFLTDTDKTYITEVTLGTATETEDSYGRTVEKKSVSKSPSQQEIENVLQLFCGNITQIAPMYSAVKVNGKKLYEYARDHESVQRPERQAVIHQLDMLETRQHANRFWLKVVCSKGTYIRTLCVDIGEKLGYPAHMSALYRTGTGTILQENTVTFQDIEEAVKLNEQKQLLLPISSCLAHMPRTTVDEQTQKRVYHGQKLTKPAQLPESGPFLVMFNEQVIALYEIDQKNSHMIKPLRVFHDD
ncbi:tRNA pseudouridine(55) synthase TruB [Barrientosiimonas marina]|uniref:tRNA pseudouridine synthase B n=1 Tax=Lentibacillus kimchii TaxID=1542911 RepID=A0ABW2UT50_9BACI